MSLEGEEGLMWEEWGTECFRERRRDGLMSTELDTQELEGSHSPHWMGRDHVRVHLVRVKVQAPTLSGFEIFLLCSRMPPGHSPKGKDLLSQRVFSTNAVIVVEGQEE